MIAVSLELKSLTWVNKRLIECFARMAESSMMAVSLELKSLTWVNKRLIKCFGRK